MRLFYCDLCGCPIKNVSYYMVKGMTGGTSTIKQVHNLQDVTKKEICEKCKNIVDRLFENRAHALKDISREIRMLFKLTSYKKNKPNTP